MMISDLPSDLIEQILLKVPATVLGRSLFTCKRWNALITDPIFITKHVEKVAWPSLVILKTPLRICAMSSNLHGIDKNVDPFIKFSGNLRLMDPRRNSQVYISRVFHCDGLLLCITTKNKRFVVWNPCTGQTMWIKFIMAKGYPDMYALGYETNKLCHNYKILRSFIKGWRRRFKMYEFCSNSWRLLDDDFPANCFIQPNGVSLKGNTYWIALSQNKAVLLCFDFSTERFQCLSCPFQKCDLSLAKFREEQLSVVQWNLCRKEMDIWVSRKIETTSVSWSKLVKVSLSTVHHLLLSTGGSLFINYDKKTVVCCQKHLKYTGKLVQSIGEEEDKFIEISLGKSTDLISWGDTFNYVPSLVRIQEGTVTATGKRKRN